MSLTLIGCCNFLHVNLVVGFGTCCVVGARYHGGMNMHGSSVGNANDQTCELNGGLLSGSIMGELLPSESLNCPHPMHDEQNLLLVHELVNHYWFNVS
jgi:hypothetical protein